MASRFRFCLARRAWMLDRPWDPLLRNSTEVIVVAIPILFAVGFIVFFVVTDQILQGEAVMRSDKIDAGIGRRPLCA